MGIVGYFAAVTPAELDRLKTAEDAVEKFLHPGDGAAAMENFIDVDKAWHGIHYLLTGAADGGAAPHSLAVLGGREFGNDMFAGPARYLSPDEVAQVARMLAELPADALALRFRPRDMENKQVYPEDIWVREDGGSLAYLLFHFGALNGFYRDAAARRDAVIQWLS